MFSLSATQRIDKCVALLASQPTALDILLTSLRKAHDNPNSERFRKVPVEHPTFKMTVGQASGGRELLFACGYEPMHGHLVLQTWDGALLARAIKGLEAAREGPAYCAEKARLEAEKAAAAAKEAARAERAKKRAWFANRVPKEPDLATSEATSCVQISVQIEGQKVASRRFDSEHTLQNLIDFIRSLEHTPDGQVRLQNITTAPYAELDLDKCRDCSLYSLDLWPVSHVRVVPLAA